VIPPIKAGARCARTLEFAHYYTAPICILHSFFANFAP
jgi:hypothetical protein